MGNLNKKYYQTLFLIIFLLTAYCLRLNATIRYVSKTGSSTPPYLTWETAADSIQKCINICVSGDTIYVANGVYQEQVVMIYGLSLIGASADSCIINTQALVNSIGFVAVDVKDNCLLTGFQIIVYYNNDKGYGVNCHGNCKVMLNRITKAGAGFGLFDTGISVPYIYNNIVSEVQIGAVIFDSSPIVRGNNISTTDNSAATFIAGVYIECVDNNYTPILDSNYIAANPGNGILKSFGAKPTIKNNIITFTQYGADAIKLGGSDSANVFNNLILVGTGYGGIVNNSVYQIKMINNYVVGNPGAYGISAGPYDIIKNNVVTGANIGIVPYTTQDLTFQYNNAWNNNVNYSGGFTPDSTNLSVDPMIVNDDTTLGELDFHLQKYSPLIDAGDPNILDKDGTRSDIGIYGGHYGESYLYQDLSPKPPRGLFAVVDTNFIILSWQRNTEADFSHYNLYRDTTSNFTIDSTKLVGSSTDTFYLHTVPIGVNRLYFKLTGVDNQENESNPSEEVTVILVTVKNEWKPVNNYILYQNYPNPFNPTTTIGYKLKERAYVKLYVYDVKGELVEVLVNQYQEAGYYEVEFNGDGKTELIKVKNPFVSGVYLCQIIVQSEKGIPVFSDIKKMILLK
jgi:hypothetical protein